VLAAGSFATTMVDGFSVSFCWMEVRGAGAFMTFQISKYSVEDI